MANLNNLFAKSDNTEAIQVAREAVAGKLQAYLAYQKKVAKFMDTPLKDVVSPITGKKFSETFAITTSTGGYPEVLVFPWFDNTPSYARFTGVGAAIRALVKAFGVLRYQTLEWHRHEASFDPTLSRVNEVLSYTDDGVRWVFKSWQNGNYVFQPMTEGHIRNKTALHRELDFMLACLEWKHPFGIVLSREAHLAEFEAKVKSRLDMPVKAILEAMAHDAEEAQAASALGLAPTTNGNLRKAVIGDVDLESLTKSVTVLAFLPRLADPIEYVLDPKADDFQNKLQGIRNSAPVVRFQIKE